MDAVKAVAKRLGSAEDRARLKVTLGKIAKWKALSHADHSGGEPPIVIRVAGVDLDRFDFRAGNTPPSEFLD